jgi:hypothetical protein
VTLANICTPDDVLLCACKLGVHLDPAPDGKLSITGLPVGEAGDVLLDLLKHHRDEIRAELVRART